MRVVVTTKSVARVSSDLLVQVFAAAGWKRELHPTLRGRRLSRRVGLDPGMLSWLEPVQTRAPLGLAACVAGAAKPPTTTSLRALGARIERAADQRGLKSLVLAPCVQDVAAVLEGILVRAYGCTEFAPDEEWSSLEEVTVCVEKADEDETRARLSNAMRVTEGVNFGRSVCDLPANVGTPATLVQRARTMAGAHGIRVRAFDATQLDALNMNLMTAVGRGGSDGSRLLLLDYRGASEEGEPAPLVIIGKGVTHDTGGYNLKRSDRLHEMSYDKAGATAVLGAMQAIAGLELPLNVTALVPLAENGIGPGAMKPGDIVTSAAGTSVCIENTDAEGRLLLADALHYAKRLHPRLVVDLASLTAASAVALGEPYAALFSNDDDVGDLVRRAGESSGDAVWPLPIHPRHVASLTHHRAHLRNVGGGGGESCVAAAFLSQFVDYPWAHIDFAMKGLCRSETTEAAEGATGWGTRLLVDVARSLCSQGALT